MGKRISTNGTMTNFTNKDFRVKTAENVGAGLCGRGAPGGGQDGGREAWDRLSNDPPVLRLMDEQRGGNVGQYILPNSSCIQSKIHLYYS